MHQKSVTKGFSFFTVLMLILTGIAILVLLISYLAFHVSPAAIPYIAFVGLAYPYILLVNILFVVFWIAKKIRLSVIPLAFILLGWNHTGRLFQWSGKPTKQEEGIKVVSYNIQNFIKYNTSTTKYVSDFGNQDRITNWLAEQSADIVCLQEMLYDRDHYQTFANQLGKLIHCPNSYHENYYQSSKGKLYAIAIFTKYPIINKGHFVYDGKSYGIFTDIIINNDTVRLYNLHLASIHFRKEDYDFISELSTQQEQAEIKTGTLQIIEKMEVAYKKRALQVDILENAMAGCTYPVILCGDFNDSPNSYTYHRLGRSMRDAFVESGSGLGTTYAGKNFPAFRIDYIFHDPRFESAGFERHKLDLSDHYPISCMLYPKLIKN